MMYGEQQPGGDFPRGPPMRQPSASSTNLAPEYPHPPAPYEGTIQEKDFFCFYFFLFVLILLWLHSFFCCFSFVSRCVFYILYSDMFLCYYLHALQVLFMWILDGFFF